MLANKSKIANKLQIIKKIENIRKNNNVNWMNILRVAFKHDPDAASKIMSKVYLDDTRISKLVKKLVK